MTDLLELVKTFGPVAALLLAILWAGYKGYWVWGRELTNCTSHLARAERGEEDWRQAALAGTAIAEALAAVQKGRER